MKKTIGLLIAGILFSAGTADVSAYGGGVPVFPGFGKPVQIVCKQVPHQIAHGRTILIKKCEVVKDRDFKDRLRDFIERVRHGDR